VPQVAEGEGAALPSRALVEVEVEAEEVHPCLEEEAGVEGRV